MIQWAKDWMYVCFLVSLIARLTELAETGLMTIEQVDELARQLEKWVMRR